MPKIRLKISYSEKQLLAKFLSGISQLAKTPNCEVCQNLSSHEIFLDGQTKHSKPLTTFLVVGIYLNIIKNNLEI